jgi:hypothetical protein
LVAAERGEKTCADRPAVAAARISITMLRAGAARRSRTLRVPLMSLDYTGA